MKRNIVVVLAALALFTTACGSNASYRGVVKQNSPTPEIMNEQAESTVEEKAAEIVSEDLNNKFANNTMLSDILAKEIRGVSVKIVAGEKDDGRPTMKSTIEVSYFSLANDECVATKKSSAALNPSDISTAFINIKDGGRFRCLEEKCENALLMIEESRYVKMVQENGREKSELQNASLAVLLKLGTDGVYKPVNTESLAFAAVLDAKTGEVRCNDELEAKEEEAQAASGQTATAPQLSTSDRVRAAQAAKMKADQAAKARASAQEALKGHVLHSSGR